MDRAIGGDRDAYAELVRQHQDIAFRTAFLVTGSAAEAEDAAQEGFVKAWRSLDRFRRGAPFRPWLLAIVVNEARNQRRHAGRQAALALRAYDPRVDDVEEHVSLRSERERVVALVSEMREDDRLAIGCRYFLGLSEEEMADALGWPRGTVKSRLSRALGRLREAMEAQA